MNLWISLNNNFLRGKKNKQNWYVSFFPILHTFHFFSCLTVLSSISSIVLNLIHFKFESPSKYPDSSPVSEHSVVMGILLLSKAVLLILEQFGLEGLNTSMHNLFHFPLILTTVKPKWSVGAFCPLEILNPQFPAETSIPKLLTATDNSCSLWLWLIYLETIHPCRGYSASDSLRCHTVLLSYYT